jgi:hypothetical protein
MTAARSGLSAACNAIAAAIVVESVSTRSSDKRRFMFEHSTADWPAETALVAARAV